ncbi:hypothetical protein MHU86_13785 [Fragilaria crotonensis]|nr:hypothetical protein MHU86_13785 [Fragilaria crotonensis]
MTDIVNSMKPTLPWLTKDMLRNHIKKLNKEKMKRDEAARPPDDMDVAASPANDGGGQSTSTLSALTLDTGGNSDTMPGTTSSGSEDNLGGRPKGSSAEQTRLEGTQTTCNACCNKAVPRGAKEKEKTRWINSSTNARHFSYYYRESKGILQRRELYNQSIHNSQSMQEKPH